jgi:hypothetical protein
MEILASSASMGVSGWEIEGLMDGEAAGACDGTWEGFAGGAYEGGAEVIGDADSTIPKMNLTFTEAGTDARIVEPLRKLWNPSWIKTMQHLDAGKTGKLTIPWLRLNVAEKINRSIQIVRENPTDPGGIGNNRKHFLWNVIFRGEIGYLSTGE